jgi:hypothetical protein
MRDELFFYDALTEKTEDRADSSAHRAANEETARGACGSSSVVLRVEHGETRVF